MVLNYNLCVGLYAYLRQIELSLDRCLPTDIDGLKSFFLLPEVYNPLYVHSYFEKLMQKEEGFLFVNYSNNSFFSGLLSKNKLMLKKQDMATIVSFLHDVSELINLSQASSDKLIEMRISINRISWNLIGRKLAYKFRLKAHSVEHYHQSEYMNFSSIDTILGVKWLE